MSTEQTEPDLSEAAQGTGIDLLVLFGSRARGQTHPHSDWDLGYLGDRDANIELLADRVAHLLGNDESDLVNLGRPSALLRFRVASEGRALFEAEPGLFRRFQDEVSRYWCEIEPVLSRAYASILDQVRSA